MFLLPFLQPYLVFVHLPVSHVAMGLCCSILYFLNLNADAVIGLKLEFAKAKVLIRIRVVYRKVIKLMRNHFVPVI